VVLAPPFAFNVSSHAVCLAPRSPSCAIVLAAMVFKELHNRHTWKLQETGTNNNAGGRTCKTPQDAARVATLSLHNTAARAAIASPQMANAVSTTHRGAAPTLRNKKGKKFHVVICT
jgi:hypothetical protein